MTTLQSSRSLVAAAELFAHAAPAHSPASGSAADDPFDHTLDIDLGDTGILDGAPAAPQTLAPGHPVMLGQYRIIEGLGAGGMGQVYKAEHTVMNRIVALKVIAPQFVNDDQAVANFHREVRVAAQLGHPNIVTAYDASQADGIHFLVMEYAEGIDLGRLVRESGPLPVVLACEYVRQIALGLQHAHELGLVHRDIKPANALVRRPADSLDNGPLLTWPGAGSEIPLVKVLDFGLACLAGTCLANADLQAQDAAVALAGTPDYLAPENAKDSQVADIRGDLYSLGCTFYFLLTGQVPFPGGTCYEKLVHHQFDLATPVSELRLEIPVEVEALVDRLMAKKPEERFATPHEVVDYLETWLDTHFSEGVEEAFPVTVQQPRLTEGPASHADSRPAVSADLSGAVSSPRRRWRLLVMTAVAVGMYLGLAAWSLAKARKEDPLFVVAGSTEVEFNRLEKAIAAAKDGDTIFVHGNGPFPVKSMAIEAKALTIKAAPGFRPRFEFREKSGENAFITAGALALEGLTLIRKDTGRAAANGDPAPLIECTGHSLRVVDCELMAPGSCGLLVCRSVPDIDIRNCRIEGRAAGLCFETGAGAAVEIRLEGNTILMHGPRGAGISLWAAQRSSRVRLRLERNTIEASRALSLSGPILGLTIFAGGNTFAFEDALLSCAGSPAARDWRQVASWQGRANHYRGRAGWLSAEGAGLGVQNLDAWREFWHSAEAESVEEGILPMTPSASADGARAAFHSDQNRFR